MKEFLQSVAWANLQEAAGHKKVCIGNDSAYIAAQNIADRAYGFVHELPFVGKYLYAPRWPDETVMRDESHLTKLVEEAKRGGCKWVRIEPETQEIVNALANQGVKLVRAPHDMQPKELFIVDITPSEENLFAAMKSKTRYNIRLAEKKGVKVFATKEKKYQDAFLDLITATALRKDIVSHPRSYYEYFFSVLPEDVCLLFVAEYEGKVVAANIVIIYGGMAIYLHGGTSDEHREVMAPMLLQWEQMKFAKERGCARYDFGGVKAGDETSSWAGITRFKTGFSPKTLPVIFPGCYDVIINPRAYLLYRSIGSIKKCISYLRKK